MQGLGTFEPMEAEWGHILLCYRPPIPPMPPLDEVWEAFENARSVIDDFDRYLSAFPIPTVAGKLFARLDAVHSSGAEGSTTTFSDLLEYQSSLRRARDPEDAEAVAGAAEAFDTLQGDILDLPEAVLSIHRRLFESAHDPYVAAQAGQWKAKPNATSGPS